MHNNGTITLITIDGFGAPFLVNGHRLQIYHHPLTKESFYQQVSNDPTLQILAVGDGNPTTSFP